MIDNTIAYGAWLSIIWMVTILLLVLLISFLTWLALRKAQPGEVVDVLVEVRRIIVALGTFTPAPVRRVGRGPGASPVGRLILQCDFAIMSASR
ncbi:hypothetical protein ACFV84_03695 [Kitasatospora sp. NPDC059811]|uniref:hypothetical protein n=1 Tax=Streptomycetaceae TaxID=2062 RepID=UPI0007AFDF99|nr:hypothetical protein [Streptomyces sp. MJM8645]